MNVDLIQDVFVAALVVSVMLSVGFTLDPAQLRDVLGRRLQIASALSFEHALMPLLAFGIAVALGAPPSGVAAVVLCAAAPGGPVGPVFAQQARGDVALAVSLVVVMGILNVVTTPLTLTLFGLGADVPGGVALPLIRTIALFQLLPLGVAMYWRRHRPDSAAVLGKLCETATKAIIAFLIVGVTIARWELLWQLDRRTLAAVGLCCLVSVGGGYIALQGDRAARRALACVAGVRNLSLGLLVASTAFDEETLLAVMVYGLLMLVVVAPVSVFWSRRAIPSPLNDAGPAAPRSP